MVTLVQFPNIKTAAFGFVVVIDGILVKVVDDAECQEEAAASSNGVVVLTPEKATIAPVAVEELDVTAKV